MTTPAIPVIGIDVARDEVVVAGGPQASVSNQAAALGAWLRHVPRDALLVCEASGGYEQALVAAAHASGHALHVANPRRVRDFARSLGRLEKTDPLDAAVLRRYGEALQPAPAPPVPPAQTQLRELVDLRLALVEELTRWRNRRAQASALTRAAITRRVRAVERDIAQVDRQLADHLASQRDLEDKVQTLCLVPGIGLTTAATVLAYLSELGRLNRRQVAKLAGLAPLNHDSGQWRGQAHIAHGRAPLRRALYCAALVASRWHEHLRAFYQRLRAHGKPFKVALIAVARKLLIILNALLKNHDPLPN